MSLQTLLKTLFIAVTLMAAPLVSGSAYAGPDVNYSPLYPEQFRSDAAGR